MSRYLRFSARGQCAAAWFRQVVFPPRATDDFHVASHIAIGRNSTAAQSSK